MGKVMEEISGEIVEFIRGQRVFFVATAPLGGGGHVNVSPKGLDCLRILGGKRVAYADLTGSGNETSAHVSENGRITLMFCGFEERPMIVRIYGRGRVVLRGEGEWGELAGLFPEHVGLRQIIVVEVSRVGTSCGFGVPVMKFVGERGLMEEWARKKGEEGLEEYRREKNGRSIDGLGARVE